ncbi:MAG: KEOPS complex subunit Cgi121 [Methanoregula sp.]|nr:KEOPS complex subunit Cgi121 [Methanoregula sp.]
MSTTVTITYEIRAARCCIDDKPGFLRVLTETARQFNTHIICFNADMLAGKRHAESAMQHAIRSFDAGTAISKTLEMEALLYAAGSRQCSVAALFGFHEGENCLWVCCYPLRNGVWDALTAIMHFEGEGSWDFIDDKKREHLLKIFNISPEELSSLDNKDRVTDLVLERVALLDVLR